MSRLARSFWPSVSWWSDVDILRRVLGILSTERQNTAVESRSRFDTSSRDSLWRRKNVSMNKRVQPDDVIDSGTVTRCIIGLNRSTNIITPLFLCLLRGIRRQFTLKRTPIILTGQEEGVMWNGAKECISPVDKLRNPERTCELTNNF